MPAADGTVLLAAVGVALLAFAAGWAWGRRGAARRPEPPAAPAPLPPWAPAPNPPRPGAPDLSHLAHDLKNPLSTLRLRVELDVSEAAAAAWFADIEAIEHLLRQHVVHAQVCAGLEAGPPTPLGHLLRRLREQGGLPAWRLEASEDDLQALRVPARAFELMLWNLLHNAGRHGQAPVSLRLRCVGGEAHLMVLDAGPGIEAGAWARGLEPALRPSARRSGDAGLGLRIAAVLAGAVGGRLLHQAFDGRVSGVGLAWPTPERGGVPASTS